MFDKLKLIVKDRVLRRRILFVLGALALFRVLANIPIPGVDVLALEQFFSDNQFLGLLNIFSGGGLSNLSIVMLGVAPYITGSIIMQLLTIMSPKLKALYQEEGEAGRRKFSQYSRLLGVPLAVIQGFGFLVLLQRSGVIANLAGLDLVANIVLVTAGSVLLMWIGELMSEFGIGNGVSLVIFAGIVAQIPSTIRQTIFTFDVTQLPTYLAFLVVGVVVIAAVVFITEAERPIPVTYAKRVRGMKFFGGASTYLPLRLNQAGVIPIIFALSLLLIPQMIGSFLVTLAGNTLAVTVGEALLAFLQDLLWYGILYFIFVVLFTYFYTAVTFDPKQISENLQKNGAFVPGVRPGISTTEYLGTVITRITLVGALFLGIIAVMPIVAQGLTGIQQLTLGGTALLIVVQVVLDLARRIDAQLSIREY